MRVLIDQAASHVLRERLSDIGVGPRVDDPTGDAEPNGDQRGEAALDGWLARARARHGEEASREAMTRARRRRQRRGRRQAILRAVGWIVAGLTLAAVSAGISVTMF